MRGFERWLNMLWKCFIVYTTRFWKYVWPFSNIVYERDKRVKYLCIWTLINVCIQKSFFDQINIFAFLKIIFFQKIFILMEKSSTYRKVHCLHIASRQTQTENLWFSEWKLLTTKLRAYLYCSCSSEKWSISFCYVHIFFFLSGVSFTNIREPQECRGRGRAFL